MAERQSGLRFDIYERVHLADTTVGIKELDEVELVPHIQVFTEGEQAILKGNLYLTGKYAGETGGESRSLEHFIPVEITLPLNRIHDLQQVSVDIDNFDVDLLSSRSLNVTGVLTLDGIEMISAPEDSYREDEETLFVHEVRNAAALEEENYEQPEAAETRYGDVSAREPEAPVSAAPVQEEAEAAQAEAQDEEEAAAVFAQEEPTAEVAPVAEAEAVPEKKEPKVVFGSKTAEQSYHLKSMIHNGETRGSGSDYGKGRAQAEEAPVAETRGESVEWTKLFVRAEEESRQFRRVKMVIVQKQESIDSIAERYNMNPREILLYNRLSDQEVAEGQVLYIPKA